MRGIKDEVKFLGGNLGFNSDVTAGIGHYLSHGAGYNGDYNEARLLPWEMA